MVGIVAMGGFWFVFKNGNSAGKIAKSIATLNFSLEKQEAVDSDNDGLADWEERLFGTDPQNPDSDGNGISDGKEFESVKKIAEIKPTDDVLNYLNQVGQALAGGGSTGNSIVPETVLEIPPDHYILEDLTLVETSEISVTQYIAWILLATKPYEENDEEGTTDILGRWLETGDSDDFEELMARGERDKALANELVKVPAPDELAVLHLSYVNSMYNGGLSLEEVGLTEQNPQAGFFAAAKYANFQSKRSEAIIVLTQYYNRYSLSFNQE